MSWQDWRVIARDPGLVLRGDLPWRYLILDDRHVDVSSLSVTMTDSASVRARLGPGWGMVLLRNDTAIMSGPLEDDGDRVWTAATDGKRGTITAQYGDDLAIVGNELAYPDPTLSAAGTTGPVTGLPVTGPAETVIKNVVAANLGTGRAAARGDTGVPGQRLLTVAASGGAGGSLTYTPRFDNLLDVIRTISQSTAGLNIGARVLQSGTSLLFSTYMPADRTARMRFSREADNLIAATTSVSMPTLTHAVILGPQQYAGSPAAAVANTQVISETDATAAAQSWRMIVRAVVDATSVSGGTATTAAEMTALGQAALAAGARAYARDVTIVETAQVRYPRDVGKGDQVTVADPTRENTAVTGNITSFHVEVDASAGTQLIQFNVGTTDNTVATSDLVNQLKILKRQVRLLQRRTR